MRAIACARRFTYGLFLVAVLNGSFSWAGDWPQWRYDAGRGSATPEELPASLSLCWVRQLLPPRPAWPASQPMLRYDVSYTPVAAGGMLLVPSMVADSVTAYDLATGAERWRFYTDGPVRFAPAVWRGRVYFGSDDGYLYCLDAARGTLRWRVRGGPYDRRVLGNQRLIGTWPIRGAPVVHDGIVYFSAGIWPFMGVFVHAVAAETGATVWARSGDGATYMVETHKSPSFSGFVPHGYLAAAAGKLVAPGGRSQPALFDLQAGTLRHFGFGTKNSGGFDVVAHGDWYLSGGRVRGVADGKPIFDTTAALWDGHALYGIERTELFALEPPAQSEPRPSPRADVVAKAAQVIPKELWRVRLPADPPIRLFLKAGSCVVAGEENRVIVVRPNPETRSAALVWKADYAGRPWTMLVADGRLLVVTVEGRIYCFAPTPGEPRYFAPVASAAAARSVPTTIEPALVSLLAAKEGYGLLIGAPSEGLARELIGAAKLHWIAIDPDANKIDRLRRRMDRLGWYGTRLSALATTPAMAALPPYLAEAAVVLQAPGTPDSRLVQLVFERLRPYGGTAFFAGTAPPTLQRLVDGARLAGAAVQPAGQGSALVRFGPLPGAADWTHQYADAANSGVSSDRLVKAPLGLLWFGNLPNDEVLPRHGHGPAPQVVGGRLFIEGPNMLRAVDVYTGRLLWQREFPGVGLYYDSTQHQPGANEIGSNFASAPDRIYLAYGEEILALDPATGETKQAFSMDSATGPAPVTWGFVAVWEDLLVAVADPVKSATLLPAPYASAGKRVVVFDRRRGTIRWTREAKYSFRHNTLVVGNGRLFFVDALPPAALDSLKRRGEQVKLPADYQPCLWALDAPTGRPLWHTTADVFGTFLNYSVERDVLLQAGSAGADRARDEAKTGMIAYRGRDGTVLWKDLQRAYYGPCLLHHDTIITQIKSAKGYSLLTGQPKLRQDPLTGQPILWGYYRGHGCNSAIGSEHLLCFRSSAAGYYDLLRDGGTGNLGGFKSGCTSNLIAADGVLNAPDYTRTCTCAYQNQTSLAMIHDPQAEMWTTNLSAPIGGRVRQVGINFGAPGDRLAENGTLWLDYPSRGGSSPDIPVQVEPRDVQYFCHHSALVRAAAGTPGLSWVAASGATGVTRVTLTLCQKQTPRPAAYTVRLHFAEVASAKPGQRVFALRLQDRQVAPAVDIVREAGPMTALVKSFPGIQVTDKLRIALEPKEKGSLGPVLCGVEVLAEGW